MSYTPPPIKNSSLLLIWGKRLRERERERERERDRDREREKDGEREWKRATER